MMHKFVALILTMLLCIFTTCECHSQDNTNGQTLMTVDGKVAGVDTSNSTITIKSTNELTFSVTLNTLIKNDIYDIKLSDIQPGDYVTVEHYEDRGKLVATKITVQNKEI